MKTLTPATAYRRARFREFHDENGQLTFDDFETRLHKIRDLPLYDLKAQRLVRIADIPSMWNTQQDVT